MLRGKTVILGVTGSIAAYKTASLASMLVKLHCDVHVIMTQNATNFIHPIAFETLTNNKCLIDTFDRDFEFHVSHVNLGQKADVMMIAPASANVIGKLANGIADDMLTTTAMATTAKIILSPAMNTKMYENQIFQDNMVKCKHYGMEVIEPDNGFLACRDIGPGKMPEPEVLLQYILKEIGKNKDLIGKKVLVTAGPTQESIDPVRYLTNHSTGKMGYELARAAMLRGAQVTLISGPVAIKPPMFVQVIPIVSAADMYDQVMRLAEDMDFIIKAAAVADYKPQICSDEKIKKKDGDSKLSLVRTKDILATLGEKKLKAYICGFSMETDDVLKNSRSKLFTKHVDMMIANSLRQEGAGFGTDTNVVTIITNDEERELPMMSKADVAHIILDEILKNSNK